MQPRLIGFLSTLLVLISLWINAALADQITNYIPETQIPKAQKVGEARLSVLFWDVYDMVLYAPDGAWSYNEPFALSIHYLRKIDGEDIANRSIEEMRGQGLQNETLLAQWYKEIKAIFPDVKKGTVLTAIFLPGQRTDFFENEKLIGTVKGGDFLHWFSGIWLSDKTSEPALRKKLLGES